MTDYLARYIDNMARTFSEQALYWAGESQKPTAIPSLVLVASTSLLVVLGWIWGVGVAWRIASRRIRR